MMQPKPDPMIARDLVGYGEFPPHPAWPGDALIAVNFNLNIEGGGEASLANGDDSVGGNAQRHRRSDADAAGASRWWSRCSSLAAAAAPGACSMSSRDFSVAASVLGVARALEQNPELARACVARGHEIVCHGYRWIDYGEVPEDVEREHIRRAIDVSGASSTGARPVGWMTGRPGPNTRRLLVEAGGFLYDREFACGRAALLVASRRQAPSRHPLFLRSQ